MISRRNVRNISTPPSCRIFVKPTKLHSISNQLNMFQNRLGSAAIVVSIASVVVTMIALHRFARNRKVASRLPFPPGPRGLPIIGNVLDMPEHRLWEWAAEKSKKYGELLYLFWDQGSRPHAILSSSLRQPGICV